ncbi:MAG: 2-C-methyl-D-erythritol 4-phosphate cytidylyltransferase [Nocardioidaceae bacterium]
MSVLRDRSLTAFVASLPADTVVVVHDPMCPLVTTDFVEEVRRAAGADGTALAVRPVTDTIKVLRDDVVVGTEDRDRWVTLAAPLVGPAGQWVRVGAQGADLLSLATSLRRRLAVMLVEGPPSVLRVHDAAEIPLLAAMLSDSSGAEPPPPDRRDTSP